MRVDFIIGRKELYFLKTSFVHSKSEIKQKSSFFSKDITETVVIFLICAVLFGALSFWTMIFLEFIIWLFKQIFFFPLIFETLEKGLNFTGINGLMFIKFLTKGV